MRRIREQVGPSGPALVAFPEDVGTFAVFFGHGDLLRRADSIGEAVRALIRRRRLEVGWRRVCCRCSWVRALALVLSPEVEAAYRRIFSKAARRWRSFVVADLPGLIEGAHRGAGLGHQFLRHIERTRALVHVLDVSPLSGRDPLADFRVVQRELAEYQPRLATLPQIVALNKIDLPGARAAAKPVRAALESEGYAVYAISALTGEGVRDLVYAMARLLESLPPPEPAPAEEPVVHYTAPPIERWSVARAGEHEFVVRGKAVERLVAMTDLTNDAAVRRLHRILDRMGVIAALRDAGARDGDDVRIGDVEFAFVE